MTEPTLSVCCVCPARAWRELALGAWGGGGGPAPALALGTHDPQG